MTKTYTKVGWKNGTTGNTPINKTNLDHMDSGIKNLYDNGALAQEIFIGKKENALAENKLVIEETENHNSVSGTEINITDGIDSSVKRLRQYGYTKQDGTPTPDAPIEIEVATGSVSARSTGKNLFNKDLYTFDYVTQNNTRNVTGYKDVPMYVGKADTSYFISTNFLNGYTPYGKDYLYVLISNNASENSTWVAIGHTGGKPTDTYYNKTITSDANGYLYLRVNVNVTKSQYEELMENVEAQIEEGTTKTEYQKYQESSIQYNLGDNFLADKDYIENGVLNKHIVKILLDGSDNDEQWALYSNDDEGISFALWKNGMKLGFGVSLCDKYKNVKQAWGSNYKNSYGIYSDHMGSYVKYFRPPNANITTVEQWKAYLNENPITMYYEIETPEQIQLETTGELRTFEPNTIITNDLGSNMEVDYATAPNVNMYYRNSNGSLNKMYL